MEGIAGPNPASPSLPLLHIGPGCPHGSIIRHVVVRRVELHLGAARVDYEDHVVDGDGGFGDVGRQDDLKHKN